MVVVSTQKEKSKFLTRMIIDSAGHATIDYIVTLYLITCIFWEYYC